MLALLPQPVMLVRVVVSLIAGVDLGRDAHLLVVVQQLRKLFVVGRTATRWLDGRNQTRLGIQADMAFVAQILRFLRADLAVWALSLIHISEPTRLGMISYAVFCL